MCSFDLSWFEIQSNFSHSHRWIEVYGFDRYPLSIETHIVNNILLFNTFGKKTGFGSNVRMIWMNANNANNDLECDRFHYWIVSDSTLFFLFSAAFQLAIPCGLCISFCMFVRMNFDIHLFYCNINLCYCTVNRINSSSSSIIIMASNRYLLLFAFSYFWCPSFSC